MSKRYTRKEIREPDEFLSFWQRAYQSVRQSQRPLLIVLSATVVVCLSAWGYSTYRERKGERSTSELAHAIRISLTPLLTEEEAKQTDRHDDVPRFKTAAERRAAALKELDAIIARTGTSSGVGLDALLPRGRLLLEDGKADAALAAYGDFLSHAEPGHHLRFVAIEGRAYAHEAKNELDKAIEQWKRLESEWDIYKDRAQYQQARLLEKKGDKKGAEALYKTILDKIPNTPLREDISNRLAALETR